MGETPLDVAVDGAALVARAALLEGDQVALTVLGAHTSTTVEPGDGGPHLQRIVSALVDSARVSEAGETELTDGELAQIVARYLRHQEGIETQLERAPALDDAGWAHIVTGPRGELYDGHVLARACQRLVGDPARPDAIEPALRRFCRARCLDLPPRLVSPAGHARIIADAIAAASLPRSARALVLWTTLGKEPDTASPVGHEPIARALQLIRRRRHRLIMLLPVASQAALAGDEAVSALAARVDRRRGENAARRLRGLGVTVQLVAAGEPPGAWLRRLSRLGRRPDFPSAPAARPHVGAISGG